jgi:hypothetical protein
VKVVLEDRIAQSLVTGYELNDPASVPVRDTDFCFRRHIQTAKGPPLCPIQWALGLLSAELKRSQNDTVPSSPSISEI